MGNSNLLFTITPLPFFSLLIWVFLVLAALYLARRPFHRCVAAGALFIYHSLRLASFAVKQAEKHLQARNREVLLSAGMEAAEHRIERDFVRLGGSVQRDLQGYDKIQCRLNDILLRLEDDLQKSAEIPQSIPDWAKILEAVASIQPGGDSMVIHMLGQIHGTIGEQYKTACDQHRRHTAQRHHLLGRMRPVWRAVRRSLAGVETAIIRWSERSARIDRHMDDYEKIQRQQDTAVRRLSSSSLTRFIVSGLVLAAAAVGAVVNFNLVAFPMVEMAGGGNYIGSFKVADVAAAFLVCLQIVIGIFIMDSLRVTRLFSIIGDMQDHTRRTVLWILLGMLCVLALAESTLAGMRAQIAAQMEVLRQSLAGMENSEMFSIRIPAYGQMIMGLLLPMILALVAIPFEAFLTSARTVFGAMCAFFLRVLAAGLRLGASSGLNLGRLIVNVFDLIIFLPLWIESLASHHLLGSKAVARSVETGSGKSAMKQMDPVEG